MAGGIRWIPPPFLIMPYADKAAIYKIAPAILFQHAFFFPEFFRSRMKRGNDVGGAGFQAHVFKGLFLLDHVLEALVRVNQGEQFVNDIRGNL